MTEAGPPALHPLGQGLLAWLEGPENATPLGFAPEDHGREAVIDAGLVPCLSAKVMEGGELVKRSEVLDVWVSGTSSTDDEVPSGGRVSVMGWAGSLDFPCDNTGTRD